MILVMYAKGGNVNMTDKLCVEIYWNYQPFPTNIHANVLENNLYRFRYLIDILLQ
jgi:hypothetical protein